MNDEQKDLFNRLSAVSHLCHQNFQRILEKDYNSTHKHVVNLNAAAMDHKLVIHREIAKVRRKLVCRASEVLKSESSGLSVNDLQDSTPVEETSCRPELLQVEIACGFNFDEFLAQRVVLILEMRQLIPFLNSQMMAATVFESLSKV